ncbi:CD225/dispanin family protein [Marinilabiliaceae bacterium ANBcel2]|nr:CD225/dispanin family protein [Marinilabiliaceae bacterium ANBcel2]
MHKFYFTDGYTSFGPYSLEELKEYNISRNTLVWFQGLSKWTRAEDLLELRDFFNEPPLPNESFKRSNGYYINYNRDTQQPPKTWLVESILVTLFCCLPFGIVGIVNAAKVESRFYAGDFAGARKASSDAKIWTLVSLGSGLLFVIIYLILIFTSFAALSPFFLLG